MGLKFKKIKIDLVGGARPNFVKIAPLHQLLKKHKSFDVKFVNTGQHVDQNLSTKMIDDLRLSKPDYDLKVGLKSPNNQISQIIKKYDEYLLKRNPNLVIVFGDVNSTLAIALATNKRNIKIAHVEAGLRCYDNNLPEEVNRRLTDSISDYLFTPTRIENENLLKENISKNIFFVGNIMIDSLINFYKRSKKKKLKYGNFDVILTLHRPENVDNIDKFRNILDKIKNATNDLKILFPMHPRTRRSFEQFNLNNFFLDWKNIKICPPLAYSEFLLQIKNTKFVITDSGGIQEETTFLGINCFTLRENTERPITITKGSNKLIKLTDLKKSMFKKSPKRIKNIHKWDGKTSERIIKILEKIFSIR